MAEGKLGFNAAFAMAVGGMIGGGIFATLGVVISHAGSWAWLSFLLGGLIALATGFSYARLTIHFDREGGAYTFLHETGHKRLAAPVAWALILGYTLTVSVYAYTFGAYLAHALGGPPWLAPAAAMAAILVLAGINLKGIGEAAGFEIFAVWGKLGVLAILAAIGIAHWEPDMLVLESTSPGIKGALVGAAAVFMSYEGFQLLAYDYEAMDNPRHVLQGAVSFAIICTILVYVGVALGAAMLVGAPTIVADHEVALAEAGRQALGEFGFVAVTIAAGLSTASAINATLFSTARLSRDVALKGDLPKLFEKVDDGGVPYGGVIIISLVAGALALFGGLENLVQSASFVFLGVFALVNWLCLRLVPEGRSVAGLGMVGAILAAIVLAAHHAGAI